MLGLNLIAPKCYWGVHPTQNNSSVVAVADNEYVFSMGTRLLVFDNNANHGSASGVPRKTILLDDYHDVLCILIMVSISLFW